MSSERMSVKPGNSRLDIDKFATEGYLILKGVLGGTSLLSDMRREIEELRKAVIGWKSSYQDLVEKFNQLSKSFRELQERVEGDGK